METENGILVEWLDPEGKPMGGRVQPEMLSGFVAQLDALGREHVRVHADGLLTPRIEIEYRGSHIRTTAEIICHLFWDGQVGNLTLDRPTTGAIGLNDSPHYRKKAEAYQRAVAAGKLYSQPQMVRDINGHWYVIHTGFTGGKWLKNDLRKIGYWK